MPIILKIKQGTGARGLLNYLSQLNKASILHHPENDPKIYERIHLTDVNWHSIQRTKFAARLDFVPRLHQLNVVHNSRPANPGRRDRESDGELLLPRHAFNDLERGSTDDAQFLRRSSYRPGSAAIEKRGGRGLLTTSAPPTFSNFAGTTPRQIAYEFAALRKMKPRLSKAVAHLMLSPGPDDKRLSLDQWKTALEISLAEHGAAGALFAAWIHEDTDHQHLHCMYSRILPTGQVISDSHSYQKNRSASKKITQELQLIPFTDTPNPTAPGDRAALDNANLSAERRGDDLPRAEVVRSALQQSRGRAEYEANLRAAGIETEFPTRGLKNEIFGSSMRVIGSETWVKSSTIAKDLSWPKIKSRFPLEDWFTEDDSAERSRATQSGQTAQVAPTPPAAQRDTRIDQDRMPSAARAILAPTRVEIGPVDQDSETGLAGVSTRLGRLSMELQGSSPLIKTGLLMAQIGVMSLQLSVAAMSAFWTFIKRLLRSFGIALRPKNVEMITPSAPPQLDLPTAPPAVKPALEPYFTQSPGNQNVDEQVSQLLQQVLDSVETGELDKLPAVGDGTERAALLAALESEAAASSAGGSANASSEAPQTNNLPLPLPLPALFEAVKQHQSAHSKMMKERSVDTPEVSRARAALANAEAKLDQRSQLHAERLKSIFTRPLTPVFSEFAAGSISLVEVAKKTLEAATEKFPPVISPRVQQTLDSAKKNVLDTAEAVQKEFRAAADRLDSVHRKQVADAEISLQSQIDYFSKFSVLGHSSDLRDIAMNAQKALAKALADQEAARAAELAQKDFDNFTPLPVDANAAALAAAKAASEKPRG